MFVASLWVVERRIIGLALLRSMCLKILPKLGSYVIAFRKYFSCSYLNNSRGISSPRCAAQCGTELMPRLLVGDVWKEIFTKRNHIACHLRQPVPEYYRPNMCI
jgi:hypothetical protein